jgi:hypothetical protein
VTAAAGTSATANGSDPARPLRARAKRLRIAAWSLVASFVVLFTVPAVLDIALGKVWKPTPDVAFGVAGALVLGVVVWLAIELALARTTSGWTAVTALGLWLLAVVSLIVVPLVNDRLLAAALGPIALGGVTLMAVPVAVVCALMSAKALERRAREHGYDSLAHGVPVEAPDTDDTDPLEEVR